MQFKGDWLCTSMVVTLHPNGCFFALHSPLSFLEAKSPINFFLILKELHSATESFTFLTRNKYTSYENTLLSLLEYTSFS